MIRDLLFPIDLVIVPTMREADGLAMSSRNRYLSTTERSWAPLLYKGLEAANKALKEQGIRDRQNLVDIANRVISSEKNLIIEYLSISDPVTLAEVDRVSGGAIFSGAIKVGKTRIIDNLLLDMTVKDLGCTLNKK
jgi:pantoate--beta-alanine ligase